VEGREIMVACWAMGLVQYYTRRYSVEVLLSNGETHPLGPCHAVAHGWKTRNFEVYAERKTDRAHAKRLA